MKADGCLAFQRQSHLFWGQNIDIHYTDEELPIVLEWNRSQEMLWFSVKPVNLFFPGRCGSDFEYVIFKHWTKSRVIWWELCHHWQLQRLSACHKNNFWCSQLTNKFGIMITRCFQWTHLTNRHPEHFSWNCYHVNATGPHWWYLNIGSSNGLMSPGNNPLPMLTNVQSDAECLFYYQKFIKPALTFGHR